MLLVESLRLAGLARKKDAQGFSTFEEFQDWQEAMIVGPVPEIMDGDDGIGLRPDHGEGDARHAEAPIDEDQVRLGLVQPRLLRIGRPSLFGRGIYWRTPGADRPNVHIVQR